MSIYKIVKDSDPGWLRNTSVPGITKTDFKSYKDQIKAVANREKTTVPENKKGIDKWIDSLSGFIGTPNLSNSSVGGNDAFNPYWAFNEDDDIALPMDKEIPGTTVGGMGSVYKEMYEQHQQILWVTFGTPRFNTTLNFQRGAVTASLASLMNRGDTSAVWTKLGSLMGDGFVFLLELPFLPLIGISKIGKWLFDFGSSNISAYYSFKHTMPLYYRMVNTLLSQIAVGMGLYDVGSAALRTTSDRAAQIREMYHNNVPKVLENGPNIFEIKHRRAKILLGRSSVVEMGADRLLEEANKKNPKKSIFSSFTGFMQSIVGFVKDVGTVTAAEAQGAGQYIGFRIEKSTGSSESISNSVGDSAYASQLNAKSSEAYSKAFSRVKLVSEDGAIGGFIDSLKKLGNKTLDIFGGGGQAAIRLGGAYYDIPQTWKSSSFSKSYTLNMKLEARLGDPISIFQSIYIPLVCWLVAALPRQVGKKGYTSPFIMKAYSKGMLITPLGMVTSINITRGDSEFGWTVDNLPRVINLSINVQDLNPALYVGMGDSAFKDVLNHNDTMNNYIGTLSGLSLADWDYIGNRLKNATKSYMLMTKNKITSPGYWGAQIGNTGLMRTLYAGTRGLVNDS